MSIGNQSTDGDGFPAEAGADLAAFDRLPDEVRQLLRDAPYAITSIVTESQCRTMGVDRMKNFLSEWFRSKVQAEALKLYGRDHPQANA